MKLTKKTARLIADLEYLIGKECYNPNSYDGWNDIEGCDFRYPINVPINTQNSDVVYIKIKDMISKSRLIDENDITPETVPFIKYKFGSNELFVGRGIINILEYLENRYNIDFDELEQNNFQHKK